MYRPSRAPKSLRISLEEAADIFCYANEMTSGMPLHHLRMGAGHQNKLSNDYRVSAPRLTTEEGRGLWKLNSITNYQWFNLACICNKVSIKKERKKRRMRVRKILEWWTSEELEENNLWRMHGSSKPLPHTLSYASLPCAVLELYYFIIS